MNLVKKSLTAMFALSTLVVYLMTVLCLSLGASQMATFGLALTIAGVVLVTVSAFVETVLI